jgi:hypothetical protein
LRPRSSIKLSGATNGTTGPEASLGPSAPPFALEAVNALESKHRNNKTLYRILSPNIFS